MAFGFIGDIVEGLGDVVLGPKGTRGASIGGALQISGAQLVAPFLEQQQVQQWGPLLDLPYHQALLVVQRDKKPLLRRLLHKVRDLQPKQHFQVQTQEKFTTRR